MVAAADDQSEVTMRRVETDGDAVHITTVHSAKGLEYPVVLVPFAYAERPAASRPYVFNDDGGRAVDVASWVAWGRRSRRRKQGGPRRRRGTQASGHPRGRRRLAAPALRRSHPSQTPPRDLVGPHPGGRDVGARPPAARCWGAGPVFNSPLGAAYENADAAAASKQIDAIVAASNGTIARFDVALEQPVRRPLPLPARTGAPARRRRSEGVTRWPIPRRTWSFTALTAGLAAVGSSAGVRPSPAATTRLPTPAATSRRAAVVRPCRPATAHLGDAPGGTTFGIAVHEVLERVDFVAAVDRDDIDELVAARRGDQARLDVRGDQAGLAGGDRHAARRAVRPAAAARVLGLFVRLAELAFDLTFGRRRVSGGRHREGAGHHPRPRRPVSENYGHHLASALAVTELAGWRTGSIDAVFQVGDADPRFVVVDYKTNRLHDRDADPLDAYLPDLLGAAMTHSHYPLQAVLYCVALHRYLRWRLGAGYEPSATSAASATSSCAGWSAWRRPRSTVGPTGCSSGDPRWRQWSRSTTSSAAAVTQCASDRAPATERREPPAWPESEMNAPRCSPGSMPGARPHRGSRRGGRRRPRRAEPGVDEVVLAVALAVWAPQHGHSCIELDDVAEIVAAEQAIVAADTGNETAAGAVPLP